MKERILITMEENLVILCDVERRSKLNMCSNNKYFELSTLEKFDYWNSMVSRHHKILMFDCFFFQFNSLLSIVWVQLSPNDKILYPNYYLKFRAVL